MRKNWFTPVMGSSTTGGGFVSNGVQTTGSVSEGVDSNTEPEMPALTNRMPPLVR